ncbi:MAG: TetR/AcrR family transcriptional regulator [Bowdeniella nasicola]|nr:TetR/AcrR family transcriptional regulator [Bowdeniella nasicola]
MSGDDRRKMIATSAIPLFLRYGNTLSTRQLADELGIAEGTIFRAFGDKRTLLHAVVETYYNQARNQLAAIDFDGHLTLENRLREVITQARHSAQGAFTMLSLLDHDDACTLVRRQYSTAVTDAIAQVFAGDGDQLNLPPERVALLIRMLAVAASAPHHHGEGALSDDELVNFALHGFIGKQPQALAGGSQ